MERIFVGVAIFQLSPIHSSDRDTDVRRVGPPPLRRDVVCTRKKDSRHFSGKLDFCSCVNKLPRNFRIILLVIIKRDK